jgi:hypothetical protein
LLNAGPPQARRPLLADLQLLDGTAWRLTGRLQVSRGDRLTTAKYNAAEGTVERLSNASATFRDVWRRAAIDAPLATGLLAWAAHIGAAGAPSFNTPASFSCRRIGPTPSSTRRPWWGPPWNTSTRTSSPRIRGASSPDLCLTLLVVRGTVSMALLYYATDAPFPMSKYVR